MLKKVPVEQLQQGMYVHALCGSWLSHDFWRTSFLLDSAEVMQKLRASAVQEVWIDTARGKTAPALVEPTLNTPAPATTPDAAPPQPTTLAEELERAMALCAEANTAVMHMFSEARMGGAVDVNTANNLVTAINESVHRHPDAFLSVARLKTSDNYTYMHSVAVSGLMVALARSMRLSTEQVHQAGMAGLLHDMGKAHTRLEVLNKPGPLTDEEFMHMKQHPSEGYALLKTHVEDEHVLDACLHHHERMDGKGYPHGLAGEQIHVLARMACICDVYDAITSDRPYKKGWSPAIALQRMTEWCDGHFDKVIFDAFIKTIGIYPLGSMVRLQSGFLGLVCAQSPKSLSTPYIVAFYHVPQQRMLRPAKVMNLARLTEERIVAREDPTQWPFENLEALWQKAAASLPV